MTAASQDVVGYDGLGFFVCVDRGKHESNAMLPLSIPVLRICCRTAFMANVVQRETAGRPYKRLGRGDDVSRKDVLLARKHS